MGVSDLFRKRKRSKSQREVTPKPPDLEPIQEEGATLPTDSGMGTEAPPQSASELRQPVVDKIFADLMIDEEWSVREDCGFRWWGHRLAQRVWAEPARQSRGMEVFVLHAETSLLRNVPEGERTQTGISIMNRFATLSGLVYDPTTGRVSLHCAAKFHEQNFTWLGRFFSLATAMQAADAHIKVAQGIERLLGGEPDFTDHPTNGPRQNMDDMLNVLEQTVAPMGKNASPFGEVDFVALESMDPSPSVMTCADQGGVTAEFPFTGQRPAALIPGQGQPLETALFQATSAEAHPQLGSGCLCRLTLPVQDNTPDLACRLNGDESTSWSASHFFGAWCNGEQGLTFITFVPALAYQPGLLQNIFWSFAGRARWAAEWFARA